MKHNYYWDSLQSRLSGINLVIPNATPRNQTPLHHSGGQYWWKRRGYKREGVYAHPFQPSYPSTTISTDNTLGAARFTSGNWVDPSYTTFVHLDSYTTLSSSRVGYLPNTNNSELFVLYEALGGSATALHAKVSSGLHPATDNYKPWVWANIPSNLCSLLSSNDVILSAPFACGISSIYSVTQPVMTTTIVGFSKDSPGLYTFSLIDNNWEGTFIISFLLSRNISAPRLSLIC